MSFYPVFLSVVMVVRNESAELRNMLTEATGVLSRLVSDYELIVVDNASDDDSVAVLQALTGEQALPNIQAYVLTKEVDSGTATWVGLENALGDFLLVIDPVTDDIAFLPTMLDHAARGTDVVFAANDQKPRQSLAYSACYLGFNALYKLFNGVALDKEAPQYRLLSKRVVNFILQHPVPAITYRHLPATGGFSRANLTYSAKRRGRRHKRLRQSVDRGLQLLVSTTRGPMRLATSLALFGAVSNMIYSVYVILIALLKSDVAPGWVTTSLQQSGMFFLISVVLLVLGEYVMQMARLSNEGPLYHVAQEFTSAVMTRREKLNVEAAQERQQPREDTTPPVRAG